MFRLFSLGLSIVFMLTAHLTFACKNNYYHGHSFITSYSINQYYILM
ncbi:Lipoprotein [Candidatus Liberibacter solanacearum]